MEKEEATNKKKQENTSNSEKKRPITMNFIPR